MNGQPKTPMGAIRAKCLDCCCYQIKEVKACGARACPLYPFRAGKNPFRKHRELTAEQRAAGAARLAAARLAKQEVK